MIPSVKELALKDIHEYLNEEHIKKTGRPLAGTYYLNYVTAKQLYTKETLRLNRQLGLHKINKQNNYQNLVVSNK